MGSKRCLHSATECITAILGHLKSLISVPIKKHTCNFLLLINSNLGSVLPVLIAGILPKTTTHPIFHTKFGDIPLGLDCQPGGSKEQSGQFPLSGPPIMQQAGSDLPYIHIRAAPRICGQLQQDARSSHQHNHTPSCYGGAG